MDHGAVLSLAFSYTKEFCFDIKRWFVVYLYFLISTCTLYLVPVYFGYLYRIMGSKEGEAPTGKIGNLFINGWKLNLASIIWYLPVIIITIILFGIVFTPLIGAGTTPGTPADVASTMVTFMVFGLILLIITIITSIFYYMALVHMARHNSLGKAFNFSGILGIIKRVGWFNYILALIIAVVLMVGFQMIISTVTYAVLLPAMFMGLSPIAITALSVILILVLGFIALPFSIFLYRYFGLIYNEGEEDQKELDESFI